MKNSLVSIIMAVMITAMPCAALADDVMMDESVILDGGQTQEPTDVPLDSAPSLDAIVNGNTAQALLSRHSSFASYALNYNYVDGQTIERESMTALINNDNGATLYEANDALAFVYDGQSRYLIYPDGSMGVNITLDQDINAYYDAQIAAMSLFPRRENETLTSCKYLNGQYIITTTISHGDYADATGQSFDFDDSVPIVTTLTVDESTLELYSWQTAAHVADGIEIQLGNGSVVYDETTLPAEYFAMTQPDATREITLISDPDTDAAVTQVFTIAEGARPYVMPPDGYFLAVMNADKQFVEPADEDITANGALTLYLVKEAE